jgi:hypothetical protein
MMMPPSPFAALKSDSFNSRPGICWATALIPVAGSAK